MKEHSQMRRVFQTFKDLKTDLTDYSVLLEMASSDASETEELLLEASKLINKALQTAKELEIHTLMTNDNDLSSCYLEVQAGAGGTESMDWADMLLRMYTRWSSRRGFDVEEVERSFGEVAGVKSGCIKITEKGDYGYGWLKYETGVHRLVRISPFDSNARRHTSFASVFVSPIIEGDTSLELNKSELRIETYRSSGPGGQHVNTTDSAVRITHIPTGLVAKAQSDRSQHRNREAALQVLKSRLFNYQLKKREQADSAARTSIGENSWSNQIRSYVLQPYQLIKDVRTGTESHDSLAVLDGEEDLDLFLKAGLLSLGTSKAM